MESFKWDTHFITGITEVDDQHHRLVQLLNKFSEEIAENRVQHQKVEAVFQELAAYASKHFDDEEKMMDEKKLDSSHTTVHTDEHRSFLAEVTLMHNTTDPNNQEDIQSLHSFLMHWLAYHILGSDQNMARQVKRIEAGASPLEAYLAEEQNSSTSTEPLLAALKGLFQQVSKRNQQLSDLNQNLENKVLERTDELKQANRRLETMALTDVLTELPNRRAAMAQLDQLWLAYTKEKTQFSCMMIDADGFKSVNDQYGHDAGDIVLKRLAQELSHSVRSDDVVCRLGGDEFLIICPKTSLAGIEHVAEITRKNISDLKVPAGEGVWYGSISVGLAATQEGVGSIDGLLKTADQGVYLAKEAGRNCVRSIQST